MNDRSFMETMLLLEKGACDLFLHGTIESATSSVHQAFMFRHCRAGSCRW